MSAPLPVPTLESVRAEIERLAKEHLELRSPLPPEARLVEDLGLDSMRLLSLAVEVEDHFRVCLEPKDEAEITTVSDLARVVCAKLADRREPPA